MRILISCLLLCVFFPAYGENIITGTQGHDNIIGTLGDDVITGGEGHDTMSGEGGNDTFLVKGSADGIDNITGGEGTDTILGSASDDNIGLYSLTIDDSIEVIDGAQGINIILGSNYDDVWDFSLTQLLNIKHLDGASGHDDITGSSGNDIIIGGPGYDNLKGEAGNDTFLIEGIDNSFDTIHGGAGFDVIQGGAGNDDFNLYSLFSSSIERIDGGAGINRIVGDAYDHAWDFSEIELINILHIDGQGGHDYISGSQAGDTIIGGAGYDTLLGNGGDDTFLITGKNSGVDSISGGDGFDVIQGSVGDDDIGLFNIDLGSSIERINGDFGFNQIIGSGYDDRWDFSQTELINIHLIDGLSGHDTITGSLGNDIIKGGKGYDTLNGGAGDDTFLVSGNDDDFDAITGGEGLDTIQGSDLNDTIGLTKFLTTNSVEVIDGGAGINNIIGRDHDHKWDFSQTQLININSLDGKGGHDTIIGSNGNDIIIGGLGYDTLYGGAGNDRFPITLNDSGFDSVYGDDGFDVIEGTELDDTIRLSLFDVNHSIERIDGGLGVNRIVGRDHDHKWDFSQTQLINISSIDASGGHDTIIGSSANDTLIGGSGYDTLDGGEGSDHYQFDVAHGKDRLSDSGSTADVDVIEFLSGFNEGLGLAKENIWFSFNGSTLTIDIIGSNDAISINNWSVSDVKIEEIHTQGNVLQLASIQPLIDAMSVYSPPSGDGAQLTDAMKSTLYPAINTAWNNHTPLDSDGDGVIDTLDAFPFDPLESQDTDGDGIGDNRDTDSDNDGVSDDEEIAQGTDPLDPDSYPVPDVQLPVISLTIDNNQTVSSPNMYVAGILSAGNLAIAKAYIYNTLTPTALSFININADNTFSKALSLNQGANHFVIVVEDVAGNRAQLDFTANLLVTFKILSVTPASGSTHISSQVNVVIDVSTSVELPLKIDTLPVNSEKISDGVYRYTYNAQLVPGANALSLQIIGANNTLNQTLNYVFQPADMSSYPAPSIEVQSPTNNSRTNKSELPFIAQVNSNVGGIQFTLNGTPLDSTNTADGVNYYSLPLNLNDGQNSIALQARDALNQTTHHNIMIVKDSTAPSLVVDGDYKLPPLVNVLPSANIQLTGTVTATDLASLTIQGNQASLTEIAIGVYQFNEPISIPAAQDTLVTLIASDDLANKTAYSYYFRAENNLSLSWISPSFPVQWFIESNTQRPFAVKLNNPSGDETYTVQLVSPAQTISVPFEQVGDLLVGTTTGIQGLGDYQLIVNAHVNSHKIKELSGKLAVISQDDLAIQVSSVYPLPETRHLPTDTFVQVNFNRPVDVSKLHIEVRRTLHGLSYQDLDATGTDFLHAKGMQLVQIDVDREWVDGGISILPNDSSFAFYPKTDLGYSADIDWQVTYDGDLLAKQRFSTRELPTVIEGGIQDSLGQPISGIQVDIKALGLTTTTNNDGAFSFGYGASAQNNIDGGNYNITVNSGFILPKLGESNTPIEIKKGKRNQLPLIRIPNISDSIQWINVPRNADQVSLAQGNIILNLHGGKLDFPAPHSAIHAQFIPTSGMVRDIYPGAAPLWFYQIQPFDIKPSKPVSIQITMPKLFGNLNYLGAQAGGTRYSFLLAYNPIKNIIEPISVVEITDGILKTINAVQLPSLDYLGYTHTDYKYQAQFKQFVSGEISFVELVAKVAVD
jgi:Ca2+-binding RTX toxin-like protein